MEVLALTKDNEQIWDDFAYKSSSAWFRHTTLWLKYSSVCRFDTDTRNLSFMVKQNNKIVAIVPLLVEYDYNNRDKQVFKMYGDYTPLPAYEDSNIVNGKALTDFIFEKITEIVKREGVSEGIFFLDPLTEIKAFNNFQRFNMLEYGAACNIKTTNIVELSYDEECILRNMRKGHKAAIKRILKNNEYRIDVFDNTNITYDVLLKFKYIHKIDAGRQTRTDESWDCMYDWLTKGYAILVLFYYDGSYIAGALIMCYKKAAYYASYAVLDSKLCSGLVGYAIQWETIRYLKSQGYNIYELGTNHYKSGNVDDIQDNKLYEIAKFKKGFRNREYVRIEYSTNY